MQKIMIPEARTLDQETVLRAAHDIIRTHPCRNMK